MLTLTSSLVVPGGSATQEGNGESALRRSLALTTPFRSQETARPTRVSVSNQRFIVQVRSRLTTQAQRPGAGEATIATAALPPGSLQRMVRPRRHHKLYQNFHQGRRFLGGSATTATAP